MAQVLTRNLRAAHRKAARFEQGDGWGADYADFTAAPLDEFFKQSVSYVEYRGGLLPFLRGDEDIEMTLYPDGSVAVMVAAVHPSEGIYALTRKADIKAAMEFLRPAGV